MTFSTRIIPLFLASILYACAHIDEGEIDYRKVAPLPEEYYSLEKCSNLQPLDETEAGKIETAVDAAVEESKPAGKEISYSLSLQEKGPTEKGDECLQALSGKFQDGHDLDHTIVKNDIISLHLSTGFISRFPEIIRPNNGEFTTRSINGEIAVVAYVCEQGVEGCDFGYGPDAIERGRVIYYSDGVKERQYLNFSYIPVYGPITYTGKPLVIQLYVIELDVMGEQTKSMVKALADFGGTAYPPASQILNILGGVGESLLEGDQHDRLFSYSLTMAPNTGVHNLPYPHISAGSYVFLKSDNGAFKSETLPWGGELWDQLYISSESGRLKHCPDAVIGNTITSEPFLADCDDFRDRTYFTIQVQNGYEEASLDNQQTLASLYNELQTAADARSESIAEIWEEKLNQYKQNESFMELSGKLSRISNTTSLQEISPDRFDKAVLEVLSFVDDLEQTITVYRDNECWAGGDDCADILSQEQLNNIVLKTRILLGEAGKQNMPLNASLESGEAPDDYQAISTSLTTALSAKVAE